MDKGISVGLILKKDTDYVYAISSIMNQKNQRFEIICLLDENTGISAYDVLECIRVQKNERLVRTSIISKKLGCALVDSVKTLIKNSKEDGIIVFFSNDALYDDQVLIRLADLDVCDKVVNVKTVEFVNGEYVDSIYSKEIGTEWVSCEEIIESINNSGSFYIPHNLFYIFDEISKSVRVDRQDKLCLRHEKLANRVSENDILYNRELEINKIRVEGKKINYTNCIYIQNLLSTIEKHKLSNEQVNDEVDCVTKYLLAKSKGSSWGLTQSDEMTLYFLRQIKDALKIKFFRGKQLRFLKNEIAQYSNNKIKILFLTQEYHLWTSLKSVYDKAREDTRFVVDLVHIPYYHPQKKENPEDEIQTYLEAGYNIKRYDEYSIKENSPDVIILMKPYDNIPTEFMFNNLEKVSTRCIYIRYAPCVKFVMDNKLTELLYTLSSYYIMWRCIAYTKSEYESAKKFSYQRGKEWIPLGHPRDDLSINDLTKKDKLIYDEYIQLAKGRKIILWNTVAQLKDEAEFGSYGSFIELGETIIDFFEKHNEMFLIWRPHPFFFTALLDLWGTEKCEEFWKRVENIENIYVDRYENYMPAMFCSEAFISDTSSLVDLYISMLKPILLTKKEGISLEWYNSEFLNSVFVFNNKNDLEEFVSMVRAGEHLKDEKQKKYVYQNYFGKKFPQTVAERLLQYIIDEINIEEKILFTQREDKIGEIMYKI